MSYVGEVITSQGDFEGSKGEGFYRSPWHTAHSRLFIRHRVGRYVVLQSAGGSMRNGVGASPEYYPTEYFVCRKHAPTNWPMSPDAGKTRVQYTVVALQVGRGGLKPMIAEAEALAQKDKRVEP